MARRKKLKTRVNVGVTETSTKCNVEFWLKQPVERYFSDRKTECMLNYDITNKNILFISLSDNDIAVLLTLKRSYLLEIKIILTIYKWDDIIP